MSTTIQRLQISWSQLKKTNALGVLLLTIFYTVGLIGTVVIQKEDFLLLTPLNLLVSVAIILWYHPKWTKGTIITLVASFLIGYFIEVVGVNTGAIFGEYTYGPVLGWKIWETPLMIGVNWMMLVYAIGMTVNWMTLKQEKLHFLFKAAIGASIMVLLDVLIEPVAIHYNFWTWEAVEVPFQNYSSWWLISFVLLSVFHFFHMKIINKLASALLVWQFVFFIVLLSQIPSL
ncbi:MAG: carotenoid biosynthesis protein [Bacteroidota bacterium]